MRSKVIKNEIKVDEICHQLRAFRLHATELGCVVTDTTDSHGEKFSHLYRLNYVASGEVTYSSNKQEIKIPSNSLVYLPPEAILEVEENKEVVLFFINFEVRNLDQRQHFNEFMEKSFPLMYISDQNNQLRSIFNELFIESHYSDVAYCMAMQHWFGLLLIKMLRFSMSYKPPEKASFSFGSAVYFNEAIAYINQHIHENIKIPDVAEAIGISEIYLYKLFIRHSGKSPLQLIQDLRIQLAKNYLANPHLTIKTISTELGFSNTNHFTKVFKKKVGISPSQYRQSLRQ